LATQIHYILKIIPKSEQNPENLAPIGYNYTTPLLKGQSNEKVGEMKVGG
jgi:hypothetical protein